MPVCHTGNPFAAEGRWLKGALHAHTTESDGEQTPTELAEVYRDLGYDFLCFTDHNTVTQLDEPVEGILTLPGIEQGVEDEDPVRNWHVVGLGADDSIPIKGEFPSPAAMVEHQRPKVSFCILAHPYWSQLSGKDLTRFDGIDAVEVFNAGCELEIGRGHAEYQWDWCLGTGRRMTAVAVDDCHSRRDIGMAWVMVKAAAPTADAVLDALTCGAFYSSCGPEIRDVRLTETGLELETTPCRSVSFIADGQTGAHVVPEAGDGLTSAVYRMKGTERYVRVQVVDAAGRKAWSNPVYPQWPGGNV